MKNLLLYIIFVLFANALYAQNPIKLAGKVIDENIDERVPFASLVLSKDGKQIATAESDIDGNYELRANLNGIWICELHCTLPGLPIMHIKGVLVEGWRAREYDIIFPKSEDLSIPIYVNMERPMVEVDNTSNPKILSIYGNKHTFLQDAGEATNGEGKRVESIEYFESVRVFGRKLSRKELRKIRRAQKKEAKKK